MQTEKAWLKDGRLAAEGSYQSFRKNRNGTFLNTDYEIPVIEKYSDGDHIGNFDVDGKPVDVTKLRKLTEKELSEKGYGLSFGFISEFK